MKRRQGPRAGASWNDSNGQRPVVLIVEDDRSTLEGLSALLGPHFEILTATDGEEALRVAEARGPDVILADYILPGLDGLGTLEALRRQAATQSIPVVFLSGADDEATVVRCLESGAADFVAKPASSKELLARLNRAVRQQRECEALEALAQTDALTGLANFRALALRMEEEFKRADRYGYSIAAVMVDLDYLKTLNDRLGHDAGNRAIRLLASDLRDNLREVDFAARYGGDEFIVLLPHQNSSEATVFAERLRARVNTHVLQEGDCRLPLSISVGVASHNPRSAKRSPEHLLQAADEALYEAKRQGRNRVVAFESERIHLEGASVDERH